MTQKHDIPVPSLAQITLFEFRRRAVALRVQLVTTDRGVRAVPADPLGYASLQDLQMQADCPAQTAAAIGETLARFNDPDGVAVIGHLPGNRYLVVYCATAVDLSGLGLAPETLNAERALCLAHQLEVARAIDSGAEVSGDVLAEYPMFDGGLSAQRQRAWGN
jgi:hypothetical protein